jgi:effector-binding domain-containing protein
MNDIGLAYQALGAWVARLHVMSGETVREVYLAGPPMTIDPTHYVTELQWPVASIHQE